MNNHPLSFNHYEPFFIPLSWEDILNLYCRLNYCIMWVMLFGYCEVCKIKIIMSYKKQNCSNWMDFVFCFLETNIFNILQTICFSWNEWLKLPIKYPDIPRHAQVCFTIWDVYGPRKAIPVGGTTVSLFGKYG